MEKEQINQLLDKQRQYFYSGATLDLDFRISALKRLRASIGVEFVKILFVDFLN